MCEGINILNKEQYAVQGLEAKQVVVSEEL